MPRASGLSICTLVMRLAKPDPLASQGGGLALFDDQPDREPLQSEDWVRHETRSFLNPYLILMRIGVCTIGLG